MHRNDLNPHKNSFFNRDDDETLRHMQTAISLKSGRKILDEGIANECKSTFRKTNDTQKASYEETAGKRGIQKLSRGCPRTAFTRE
jgi:hypothetical protein